MFLLARLASRRNQLVASLVIFSLSSGVLGGILFYFDGVGPEVLDEMTQEVPVDMYMSFTDSFYYQNETTVEDIVNIVAEEEYVETIEPVILLEVDNWYIVADWSRAWGYYLGVGPSFFYSLPNAIEVLQDNVVLDDNSCLIQNRILIEDGLKIGDNYTATTTNFYDGEYVTKNATYQIVGSFETEIHSIQYYPGEESVSNLFMITTKEGLEAAFSSTAPEEYGTPRDELWVQVDHSIVYIEDPVTLLGNMEDRIEQKTLPYSRVDSFSLVAAVFEYTSWSASMRAITLAFSVPSILMGIMTAVNMSKLLADERRKDVGTLKTRGSSGLQAFWWILSSSAIVAILGGIGAIITGVVAAIASGAATKLLIFSSEFFSSFSVLLSQEAITAVFLFSFAVGIGVSLPSAVNAFLISPTEAHQFVEGRVLENREEMGSIGNDLILLGISMFLLSPYLLGFGYYGMPTSAYLALGITLIPLLSVFILSLSRIISRPTSQAKGKVLLAFSRGGRQVGAHVLSRNVRLFKKSETLGAMFIALVFTSGVFSAVAASTGSTHVEHLFLFQTGSDVVIKVNPGFENVTLDLLENITSVDGVKSATAMLSAQGRVIYSNDEYGITYFYNNSIEIYGVQIENWYESGFWLDYFTHDNHPSISMTRMSESIENVMTSFRPAAFLREGGVIEYGDEITIQLESPTWKNTTDCTIVDVLADSPSLFHQKSTYLPGHSDSGYFVVANIELLHGCLNTSRVDQFYVKLEAGTNHTQVGRTLRSVAPSSFASIEVAQELIDDAMNSRAGHSIFGTYTLNVMFSLIYLSGGVFIVSLIRFGRLRRQFSVMRAMGAETRSITYAVIADSVVGLLLASIAGVVIGLILAQLSLQLPLMYIGAGTASLWNRLRVVLIVPFGLLGGIIVTAVVFTLGITYLVAARNLRRNIAQEIQYMD